MKFFHQEVFCLKPTLFFPLNFYDEKGGAQLSVELILDYFHDKYNCIVLLPDGAQLFLYKNFNVEIIYTYGLKKWTLSSKNLTGTLKTIFTLRDFLSKYSGHNTILILNDPLSATIAGYFRLKYLKIIYFSRARFYKKSIEFSLKFFAKNFDSYIGISKDQCDLLKNNIKIKNSKVFEIPNPLKIPESINLKPINYSKIVLGVIGRIEENKNQILFIEIIKLLRERNISAFGEIWGTTPSKSYLDTLNKKIIKLNVENFIQFKGYTQSKLELYSNLDIVISTSFNEGLGRTLIEGMSFGKIVAANLNSGGPLSIINNDIDGLLYDHKNIDDLISKLIKIIHNKDIYKNLQQKAMFKSRIFSVRTICHQIEKHF
ncbi:MAG: glycosyltransferase [Sphingobacteriia bacterium]|nr:glycosyltransferase [Sphingobacteriia bacterium]